MSPHLLAINIGPVQEFIAAARRTRDLWFGSHLLSEISKAAARAVRNQGGELIFPAPDSDNDLIPNSPLNVANVIVATLNGSNPNLVAHAAKEAARLRWRSFADPVFNDYRNAIRLDIWNEQIDDVIEFYAAWHPYLQATYHADRASLMRLLAARKRCRDFLPAKGHAGVPKSSLDGLRESVLRKDLPEGVRRRLRLRAGEQLDVVGMVKRLWKKPGESTARYPSVARVAADSWLRSIQPERLKDLKGACRTLGCDVIHEIDIAAHPQYDTFPFEGTAVFRSRHRDIAEETGLSDADLQPLAQAFEKLTRAYDEPSPYLGVLVADGDRMGQAISKLASPDEHRRFSQALSGFSADALHIVNKHNGVLVYAGGDDVLAFAPVDRCLACARELHDAFERALADWSAKTETRLSLSIGLAIAHFMEPLEDLLAYGRTAEKHAKQPSSEECAQGQKECNGLAVHIIKRGGGPLVLRADWSSNPDERLGKLVKSIASKAVSGRIAYDMREIAETYDAWPDAIVKDAIQRDILSVMRRKEPSGVSGMDDTENDIRARVKDAASLRGLAHELLVAKEINAASFLTSGETCA